MKLSWENYSPSLPGSSFIEETVFQVLSLVLRGFFQLPLWIFGKALFLYFNRQNFGKAHGILLSFSTLSTWCEMAGERQHEKFENVLMNISKTMHWKSKIFLENILGNKMIWMKPFKMGVAKTGQYTWRSTFKVKQSLLLYICPWHPFIL